MFLALVLEQMAWQLSWTSDSDFLFYQPPHCNAFLFSAFLVKYFFHSALPVASRGLTTFLDANMKCFDLLSQVPGNLNPLRNMQIIQQIIQLMFFTEKNPTQPTNPGLFFIQSLAFSSDFCHEVN